MQEDLDNRNLSSYRNKLLEKMPEPFPNYRKSLQISINNIKTSHKADRSISGKLHADTAYGLVEDNDTYNLVSRQKITENINKELIRDKELRELANNNELFKSIIKERKIWHLRVLKKFHPIIEIKDKNNKTFKVYTPENNICAEVYEIPNDKRYVEVINLYDAVQKNFKPEWMNKYPNGKLLMRLFKGDVIGFIENRKYRYMIIKQITNDRLVLEDINYISVENNHILRKVYNQFANILNAKQFNISVTGIVTKKKTADINFWKNRK